MATTPWNGFILWRKPGSETATGREAAGPWRWWEVAVTAFTPAKKGSARLFPPAAALGEVDRRPSGHGQ